MLGSIKLEKKSVLGRRKVRDSEMIVLLLVVILIVRVNVQGMLTVNPSTLETDIPTEYRVEISETPLKLKVFSLDGSGRMAVEGTVKNSCTIMAQRNDQYSKMCKQRLIKSMVKTRYEPTAMLRGYTLLYVTHVLYLLQNCAAAGRFAAREEGSNPVYD